MRFAGLRAHELVLYNQQSNQPEERRPDGPRGGMMENRKRPAIVIWLIPVLIGFAGFYRVTQAPNFGIYRAVDIVQLLGSGVCFGAALVGIIFMLRTAQH
jgi:hypothetical protein